MLTHMGGPLSTNKYRDMMSIENHQLKMLGI